MIELKIHNIHPYHGKFYCGIPQYFLDKYGKDAKLILDPFCGSGTTLVEASIAGKRSIGVDINFLSCKVAKSKISKINIEDFNMYYERVWSCEDFSDIGFRDAEHWFTTENYASLCQLFNGIQKVEDSVYKNIFEVILSSILKTCCNKRKVWNNGYIADNVLPNMNSKINLKNTFNNKVKAFITAYKEYGDYPREDSVVIENDILNYQPKELFDMVITSPPYPFAVDFAKYNRLSYYLFKQDLNLAVKNETGARSKRSKKNCIEEFFIEMKKLYLHIMKLVKVNGYACMTVGNTRRANQNIEFVEWLIDLYVSNGWELIEDTERELQRQSMPQKRIPIEHVLVFKKKEI